MFLFLLNACKVDILSSEFVVWILYQSTFKQKFPLTFVMLRRGITEQGYKNETFVNNRVLITIVYGYLIQKELENNS